jgi:serine protease Do
MRMRNLLMILAIVLFASASAFAQRTPPAPSAPPPPSQPYIVPPPEPMAFSFQFDGMNYMGVVTEEIDSGNMSRYGMNSVRGVGVSRVSEGSPAEKAGLKKGDVILQFDGEPVTSTRKLSRLIGEAAPEQTVRLTISRNGSEQQMSVKLGKREDASRAYRAMIPNQGELLRRTPAPRVWNSVPESFGFFGSNRRVGITTTALTKQLADFFGVSGGRGLLITSISENSPASRAGLRAGDVITQVNDEKIEDSDDFIRALNFKEEGDVTLTIIRDKSQRTIKVTPERRPSPSFNLSEVVPAGTLSKISIPEIKVEIPEVRVLQSMPKIDIPVMPKIEIPIMPKIDLMTLPRAIDLPRIEQLYTVPRVL